jgi:hypothetical protein
MRAELESKRVGQGVLEDEFLLDRTVEALRLAEGSSGLELERPVALFADVGSLEEAEQVLGVERIVGVARRSRLGRLIVVGCCNGGSDGDRKRDGKGTKSTEAGMTSAQNPSPLASVAHWAGAKPERMTAQNRCARAAIYRQRLRLSIGCRAQREVLESKTRSIAQCCGNNRVFVTKNLANS